LKLWLSGKEAHMAAERRAVVDRRTGETSIKVELAIDGQGRCQASTGIGMLDHLLDHIAKHGLFDIGVEAKGDLDVGQHHTLEDVAICLGQAFDRALGERRGIVRMGHALVPMDEALALVAIDISGRGYAEVEAPLEGRDVGGLDSDLVRHFLESFAAEAKLNLHARILSGVNDHHKVEALFKALAKALDSATRIDERRRGEVPSTKGTI
jgi:imidazoleglycerol-phosphate dehydratase